MAAMNFPNLYIGSRWVRPENGAYDEVINPATEEVIGKAPVGGVAEAEQAIDAARTAFDHGPWAGLSMAERADTMDHLLDACLNNAEQIQEILTAEGGVTYQLARGMQFSDPIELCRRAIERARCLKPRHLPTETAVHPLDPTGKRILGGGLVVREPYGVVTAITPFNAPFLLNLSKIVPALLAGNTVILKPSPLTPFSALLFGELAEEAGLPQGVLNIVTGGNDVGAMLTSDPRVDMVTFTGSEAVGATILTQAAPTIKRVLLELGGKSALIVREDADVPKAAMEGLFQVSVHCGQGCALATRHIVHNSIRQQYVETMLAIAPRLTIGNPADPATVVGPLITAAARERVEGYVQKGIDEGARLVMGGKRPAHMTKGYFYEVTVFDDVQNDMIIAQEEIFGPVASVIGFDNDEDAVRIANDSRYGLYGGIHSQDPAKAFEMALQIRTGGIVINGGLYKQMDAPFGGFKKSGLGREFGDNWLDEYSQEKAIIMPMGL